MKPTRLPLLPLTVCFALTASLSSAASEPDVKRQNVLLDVYGAACPVCATALADALGQGGVQKAGFIAAGDGVQPVRIAGEIAPEADLVVVGERVKQADTLHRDSAPPALGLVLFAELDKKTAKASLAALKELKGIDAKASKADVKKGEIRVKLAGVVKQKKSAAAKKQKKEPKLTLTRLLRVLKQAGMEATFQKPEKKN